MAVSAPPKKAAVIAPAEPITKGREKKIAEVISRGSSPVSPDPVPAADIVKNFNLKITSGQLATIAELRAKRPRKVTSPKLAISLQDWLLEAVAEKVERERKRYNSGA